MEVSIYPAAGGEIEETDYLEELSSIVCTGGVHTMAS